MRKRGANLGLVKDSSGKPVRIRWKNGRILFRRRYARRWIGVQMEDVYDLATGQHQFKFDQ